MILELPDEHVNELQRRTIIRVIERAKSAHFADIFFRIGGKDERFEADWLKHLKFTENPSTKV